ATCGNPQAKQAREVMWAQGRCWWGWDGGGEEDEEKNKKKEQIPEENDAPHNNNNPLLGRQTTYQQQQQKTAISSQLPNHSYICPPPSSPQHFDNHSSRFLDMQDNNNTNTTCFSRPRKKQQQATNTIYRPKFGPKNWWLAGMTTVLILVLCGAVVPVRAQEIDTTEAPTEAPTTSSDLVTTTTLLPAIYREDLAGRRENKGCDMVHEWPILEDTNKTLLVGFLPTRRGVRTERLGLKLPGAFTYAVDVINNSTLLPEGYKLRFKWQDTEGSEALGSKYMVDLLCENVSAIFGPEHTCYVEGTVAEGTNLPMLSYGCRNERASKLKTFARTNPSEINIIRTTVATLKHNNWTQFSIIYQVDQESTMETLRAEAHRENMTIKHVRPFNKDKLSLIFQDTKNTTRIYVYIGHRTLLGEMMTAMAMTGVFQSKRSQKEYLLLFIEQEEYNPNDWHEYLWNFQTESETESKKRKCLEMDLLTLDGQFMVVANRPSEHPDIEERVREYNRRLPFCLDSYADNQYYRDRAIRDEKHIPYLPTAYIYDSVQLYARAVAELYNSSRQSGENLTVKEIARDGARIKDHLRNMTYASILGFSMTMNTNASSEGNYSVYFFSDCPHSNIDTLNCSKCLHKISNYYQENSSLEASAIVIPIRDEPECGFDDSKCLRRGQGYEKPIAISLGVLLVLAFFMSTYLYRNWKYEQEIVGLQWRINQMDLTMSNNMPVGSRVCEAGLYSTSSSLTSRQSLVSAVSFDLQGQWYHTLANYKGTIVCLKYIPLNQKRPELSRNTMKDMRNMREMKQDNVCSFVGAFMEQRRGTHGDVAKVALVTEYCMKGSLLDILAIEDIKLDRLFISSLVNDLLRGMIFLHSHFGIHGNLKSSNCVVTGRWVLQITDYGLHDIRREPLSALERDDRLQFDRHLLWRAPELLRAGIEAPVTKEGDVYSFAIILHEIIGRQGPYGLYEVNEDDASAIINKVKSGVTINGSLYRPDLNKIVDMPFGSDEPVRQSMQDSWAEDPAVRPTFRQLKVKLKGMKEKGRKGNLMDHMVQMMEQYSKNLEELVTARTHQLREEERKTKDLLHRMLPSTVAASLTQGIAVEPQGFDAVTIYFSDIVGFTSLSAESTPIQVVRFLNDLYTLFDKIIRGYDVYKVETIGDAYMVVSGLPNPNMGRHAGEIASMALELLDGVQHKFVIHHQPHKKLFLRIGLHTGPVIAGVVGLTMPRYCLFGDTVNTASRMESNGEALRIHISEPCYKALEKLDGYIMEKRGLVPMKGKGEVLTYWLNGATPMAIQSRDRSEALSPPLLQLNECDGEFRRRSPRLDAFSARTSSIPRNLEDPGDINGGLARFAETRDSPRSEIFYRRRYSTNFRTSSVDNTPRGSLLCPPKAEGEGDVHQSISMDDLHHSGISLEIPALRKTVNEATPSSSEPTLPIEDRRGVNFSPLATNSDNLGANQGQGEREPMLNGAGEEETEDQASHRGDNSPHLSQASTKRLPKIHSLLVDMFGQGLTVNGVRRSGNLV
ncbi:hypothetical protein Pcinc_015987, partial [Petrolisthes cinctipes]